MSTPAVLKISIPNISTEDIQLVSDVIKSGNLVHGDVSNMFETDLSKYLDVKHCTLVSSGTAALHLALLSLEIGPNDVVLVPNFTFPATINAVKLVGARPVLCDVCPRSYVITAETVRSALKVLKERGFSAKALLLVHEFGCPVEMDEVMELAHEHDLYVIEDAACALGGEFQGKKLGTIGHIGCFSFHPRKTLTTGEGGCIVTNDPLIHQSVQRLRNHGMQLLDSNIEFMEPGFNYRLTNIQAALGINQLKKLDQWIDARRSLALDYISKIKSSPELSHHISTPSRIDGHSWQTFMVVLKSASAKELISFLKSKGIECNIGAQVLSRIKYIKDDLCEYTLDGVILRSDELSDKTIAFPLCEQYSTAHVERVLEAVEHFFREAANHK